MSKPVLYTFSASVWSAAAELAKEELGYEDKIDIKIVNLVNGENFHPEFIDLNGNATLPTLTTNGATYTNTEDVIAYLVDNAPDPVPKARGSKLVALIHAENIDPNFALLLSRDDAEHEARKSGIALSFLSNRQKVLLNHSQTGEGKRHGEFYDAKIKGNGSLLAIYDGTASAEERRNFFEVSQQHWVNISQFVLDVLPEYLPDTRFINGSRPGEEDFHVAAWLARIVATIGGTDILALEGANAVRRKLPPRVVAYWQAWSTRDSWKTVYEVGLH